MHCTEIGLHSFIKPRPGISPQTICLATGNTHKPGCLLMPQSRKESQFNQLYGIGIFLRQLREGFVKRNQIIGWHPFRRGNIP